MTPKLIVAAAAFACLAAAAQAATVGSAMASYSLRQAGPVPASVGIDVCDVETDTFATMSGPARADSSAIGAGFVADISVAASATPGGFARAGAFADSFACYTNRGPAPVVLSFVLDYALGALASVDNAAGDEADAYGFIELLVGGALLFGRETAFESGTLGSDSVSGSHAFDVVLDRSTNINVYAEVQGRALAIAPVPLPAGGLLLLCGLAALAGLRRRGT